MLHSAYRSDFKFAAARSPTNSIARSRSSLSSSSTPAAVDRQAARGIVEAAVEVAHTLQIVNRSARGVVVFLFCRRPCAVRTKATTMEVASTGGGVLVAVFVALCTVLLCYIRRAFNSDEEEKNDGTSGDEIKHDSAVPFEKKKDHQGSSSSGGNKGKKKGGWGGRSDKQSAYTHPWLLTTLKGHTGQVLDMEFSSNGKYLASCADDRTVMIWDLRDMSQKNHKSARINVDFDYANLVTWSPDNTAFIINKNMANHCEVHKLEKKKDGSLGSAGKCVAFPKHHTEEVIGLGIACNGKYIMTCSNKTDMVISDLKGSQLASFETYLMSNNCAKISPCGRFVVASGFAPDAKVWEVVFNKAGEFQEVKRAFELTGHTSGVYDVAFDQDTSHMATVSKDSTWRLFRTNVEYKKGEDAHMVSSGTYEQFGGSAAKIALSPNSEVLVIASANNLSFYTAFDGKLDYTIEDIYSGNITGVMFDSTGKYVLTSGDKHIRVFHNVTGYKCDIASAKEKLKKQQTSATQERLRKLIADNESFVAELEKN